MVIKWVSAVCMTCLWELCKFSPSSVNMEKCIASFYSFLSFFFVLCSLGGQPTAMKRTEARDYTHRTSHRIPPHSRPPSSHPPSSFLIFVSLFSCLVTTSSSHSSAGLPKKKDKYQKQNTNFFQVCDVPWFPEIWTFPVKTSPLFFSKLEAIGRDALIVLPD